MFRRVLGLGSFVATALWVYFWEWTRSQVYERAQHMLAPYFQWVTPDLTAKYLPPAVFILVGLWLFWSTRPKPSPDASHGHTPIPIPVNPEFELVHGPYRPDEVRLLILALNGLRNILDQEAAPIVNTVEQITSDWVLQFQEEGAEKYSERVSVVVNRVFRVRMIMDNYFPQHRRFNYELQPVYEDKSDAIRQLIAALLAAADNINAVAAAQNIDVDRILKKDIDRVRAATELYKNWVNRVIQRAETKIRRLRDYKFAGGDT